MKRMIVAIWDHKAQDIVGNSLTIHRHGATAVRMFTDIANTDRQGNMLQQHTEDFDLIQVGYLNDDGTIEPAKEILLAGKIMKAAKAEPLQIEKE